MLQIDKASLLKDTISYLKELEARVEELESCMDSTDLEGRPAGRKFPDLGEKMSDNYESRKMNSGKKQPWVNKRKACDIDAAEKLEFDLATPGEDRTLHLEVHIKDSEVLIELRCPRREYLLLNIMEAVNNLHLNAHTIRSSTQDGVLALTLMSKVRNPCNLLLPNVLIVGF